MEVISDLLKRFKEIVGDKLPGATNKAEQERLQTDASHGEAVQICVESIAYQRGVGKIISDMKKNYERMHFPVGGADRESNNDYTRGALGALIEFDMKCQEAIRRGQIASKLLEKQHKQEG